MSCHSRGQFILALGIVPVGESTDNPFEGGANAVLITQIARMIEVEVRKLLGDTDLPPLLRPKSNIIL